MILIASMMESLVYGGVPIQPLVVEEEVDTKMKQIHTLLQEFEGQVLLGAAKRPSTFICHQFTKMIYFVDLNRAKANSKCEK